MRRKPQSRTEAEEMAQTAAILLRDPEVPKALAKVCGNFLRQAMDLLILLQAIKDDPEARHSDAVWKRIGAALRVPVQK